MSIAEASRPDPLAKARAVKAENAARKKREQNEVASAEPSPFDIIAELRREIETLKAARPEKAREMPPAALHLPVSEVALRGMERAMVPGAKLSPASRAKLEEIADTVATNPDEWRKQQNALTRLKLANPGVWVEIVATRRGVYLRSRQIAPAKYEEFADFTQPETLAISGDDLAKIAPGGIGKKFKIGERALVTPDAAERLVAQGFVELA